MAASIDDLKVLKTAESLADNIWKTVVKWDIFARDTVGKQITRSADSVGANIAEAFGRYHFGEKLQFLYYSRGSLFETKYWLNRAQQRQLMQAEEIAIYLQGIGLLARQLNGFLAYIKKLRRTNSNNKNRTVREGSVEYEITQLERSDLFSPEDIAFLEAQPNRQVNQYTTRNNP